MELSKHKLVKHVRSAEIPQKIASGTKSNSANMREIGENATQKQIRETDANITACIIYEKSKRKN
jgi:hypothetical protein